MSSRSNILLNIRESGTPAARRYEYTILMDDQVIYEHALSPVESQEIGEISGQHQMLLSKSNRSKEAIDYKETLGSGLFHLFFEAAWEQIKSRASRNKICLIVASDISLILKLPWEIAHPRDQEAFGFEPIFSILRYPGAENALPHCNSQLPSGPLRVVYSWSAPGQHTNYVNEELSSIKILDGLDVDWDSCDSGGFDELCRRTRQFEPQVIHLAGEAAIKDGECCFAFEDSNGLADLKSASKIRKALQLVQLVIITGIQRRGPGLLSDLGIELVRAGVPAVITWSGSISKFESVIGACYRELALGKPLESAVASMLKEVRAAEKSGMLCAYPSLLSRTDQRMVYDTEQRAAAPKPLQLRLMPLEGTTEGYCEDFVGRKRELQRLLPALREGTITALVITGPQGCGKSTLAARLAKELQTAGFSPIVLCSSNGRTLNAMKLIDKLGNAFHKASAELKGSAPAESFKEAARALRDSDASVEKRLKIGVKTLDLGRFLLILDGIESDLNGSGNIENRDVSVFYKLLLNGLTRSIAIITGDRLPEDATTMPKKAWEYQLGGLTKADFLRFHQREAKVVLRHGSNRLDSQLILQIHDRDKGLPRCLDNSFSGEVESEIYSSLSPESRTALSKAAIYSTPVNLSGLGAAIREPVEKIKAWIEEWADVSQAFRVSDDLLAIRQELRTYLMARLGSDEIKHAHGSAGEFYVGAIKSGDCRRLGHTNLGCSLEAFSHFLAAGDIENSRMVAGYINAVIMSWGLYEELQRMNQDILRYIEHPEPIRWIAKAYLEQGDLEHAKEWYQRSLRAPGGSKEDMAASLHGIASVDLRLGNYELAEENLFRLLQIRRECKDLIGQASTLQDLVTIDVRRKDNMAAYGKLRETAEIFRRLEDPASEAGALYYLASLDIEMDRLDSAADLLNRSLEIRRRTGDRLGEAAALHNLAMIEAKNGKIKEAGDKLQEALKICQQIGDRSGEAAAFFQLGILAVRMNRISEGLSLAALSAIILRSIGSQDVNSVEPVVERMASSMNFSEGQFIEMVQRATSAYKQDRGWGLIMAAF